MWTIDPQIPLGLWWALVAASAVVSIWYATRRNWAISLPRRIMFTALVVLLFSGPLAVVLNPTWVETIPPIPGNPMLTVLTDGTMSMATEDGGQSNSQSRWQRAGQLSKLIDGQRHGVDVRLRAFGDELVPIDDSDGSAFELTNTANTTKPTSPGAKWPQGHRTDLASVIQQAVRSGAPQGHAIVLLSDGAHNVSGMQRVLHAAREADALATPIYTHTIGSQVGLKNLAVTAKSTRLIAFPDTPLSIAVNLTQLGLAGQTTQVALMRDDKVLQTQTVRLTSDAQTLVRFKIPEGAQEPIQRYRVAASEVAEEATTADNQTTILVQRLSKPVGVLFLEGKPYWDSKFLTRNLGSDPIVEMTSMVQLNAGRFMRRKFLPPPINSDVDGDGEEESPASSELTTASWKIQPHAQSPLESLEFLEAYRVVILGRDTDAYLTDDALENLRTWISQSGGCLVCARGAPTDNLSSKLAKLLPVQWSRGNESRFRTEVSAHGADTSVFDPLMQNGSDMLGMMPSLATGAVPNIRAGLPQVLLQSASSADGDAIPVVTYQPYGSGQSIVVEGAGMWRWAFLAPEHADRDAMYPTLWQSLMQWIVSQQDVLPGQEVNVRSDRAHFLSGDDASLSVTLKSPQQWQLPSGVNLSVLLQSTDQDVPKRFNLIANHQQTGLYRVDLGQLAVGYYSANVVTSDEDRVLSTTTFEVRDPWFESLDLDARPDVMRQIARLSGGAVVSETELSELAARFAEHIKQQQVHEEVRTSMWDKPLVLLVILAGWVGTWVVRRKSGLV